MRGDLSYFLRELTDRANCPIKVTDHLMIKSALNYEEQSKSFIVMNDYLQFSYGDKGKEKYLRELSRWIGALSIMTYGRTLVLFSSHDDMKIVYRRLHSSFESYDIVPLIQDGESAREISMFRRIHHSVLFGVDRFWTGVDFKGPTLQQVIVPKIPIPPKGRPDIVNRHSVYANYWPDYGTPHTKMRMRQGFGRLIRAKKEKGVFICLDGRTGIPGNRGTWWQSFMPLGGHGWTSGPCDLGYKILKFLGLQPEFQSRGIEERLIDEFGQPNGFHR